MNNEALGNKIRAVMQRSHMAAVATVSEGKPRVRYMMVMPDKGFSLWTTSFAGARKIVEIHRNKQVCLTLGGDEKDFGKPYITIYATAEICVDLPTKKRYWNDMLKGYYTGPEDPNLAIIKIDPSSIEYMSPASRAPEVYELR